MLAAAAACLILPSVTTGGALPRPEVRRLMSDAKQAAETDALLRIARRLSEIPLPAGDTLGERFADDPRLLTLIRVAARRARVLPGERYYRGPACDVERELPLTTAAEVLAQANEFLPPDRQLTEADLNAVRTFNGREFLVETGRGQAQPDILLHLALIGEPPVGPRRKDPQLARGWEDVMPEGRNEARALAHADVRRRLAHKLRAVALTGQRTLGDALSAAPAGSEALDSLVDAAQLSIPIYEADRLCRIRATLQRDALIARLRSLVQRHGDDVGLTDADVTALDARIGWKVLHVDGYGAVHDDYVKPNPLEDPPPPAPAWARQVLTASASVPIDTSGGMHPTMARLAAERAAEQIARARAHDQLAAMELAPGITLADLREAFPDLARDLDTFARAGRVVDRTLDPQGNALVTVELPLERLWLILQPVLSSATNQPS